jgi:ligand-binding SRPBCC domain-containing protein
MITLKFEQELPISLEEAWMFFSSPKNLNLITPPKMDFKILSEVSENMYAGMFIRYTVKPMMNIPMHWVTEITHVKHHEFFVDEQRIGPYKIWHHEHHFKATEKGVLMTDLLNYEPPYGPIGKMLNSVWIRKQVQQIFDYRYKKLQELFPKKD